MFLPRVGLFVAMAIYCDVSHRWKTRSRCHAPCFRSGHSANMLAVTLGCRYSDVSSDRILGKEERRFPLDDRVTQVAAGVTSFGYTPS